MSDGIPILRSLENGATDQAGDVITLEIVFANGDRQSVAIETFMLPSIVGTLQRMGIIADGIKAGMPPEVAQQQLANPQPIQSLRTAKAEDGSIVLQLVAKNGTPFLYQLTQTQASEARTKLQAAKLTKPPKRN